MSEEVNPAYDPRRSSNDPEVRAAEEAIKRELDDELAYRREKQMERNMRVAVRPTGGSGNKNKGKKKKLPFDKQRNIEAAAKAIGEGPGRPRIGDEPTVPAPGKVFPKDLEAAWRNHPEARNRSDLTRLVYQSDREKHEQIAALLKALNDEAA